MNAEYEINFLISEMAIGLLQRSGWETTTTNDSINGFPLIEANHPTGMKLLIAVVSHLFKDSFPEDELKIKANAVKREPFVCIIDLDTALLNQEAKNVNFYKIA